MSDTHGFACSFCGKRHDGVPFSYGAVAPAYWHDDLTSDPNSLLADEQCVIKGEHFFVRARIVLPVTDAADDFEWGAWVSLSEANYTRAGQMWSDPGRVNEPPYFGWLATKLPYEPTTLNLKTNLHMQAVGVRPTVVLEPTEHALAVEQRTGITLARIQAIAERLHHPE